MDLTYLRSEVPVYIVLMVHVIHSKVVFSGVPNFGVVCCPSHCKHPFVRRGAGRHRRSPTSVVMVLLLRVSSSVLVREGRSGWETGRAVRENSEVQLKDTLGGCSGEEEGVEVKPACNRVQDA
jgi:hypothetical protein